MKREATLGPDRNEIGGDPADATSPVLPAYDGPCISNLVPALVAPSGERPAWLQGPASTAEQVVLVVLDGLGWDQLREREHLAPTLSAMAGTAVTTVAPSTTAAALTSITTGAPPGEHGIIGYRVNVDESVLNVLRWSTPAGDARERIDPGGLQPLVPFGGERPPVVTKAEFAQTGFTRAHLDGVRLTPYRMPSTLIAAVRRLVGAGEPFVYAYYDGIDKVAHEYGLDEHYDEELAAADRLVTRLLETLPPGATVVVTSDHGQVDVGDRVITPAAEVLQHVRLQSGEGRFRWLHARPGHETLLAEAARATHADTAWVRTRDEVVGDGWFGAVRPDAARLLGDVALVAREPVAYDDPEDTGPFHLVGRHGSLTAAEMLVPCLSAEA